MKESNWPFHLFDTKFYDILSGQFGYLKFFLTGQAAALGRHGMLASGKVHGWCPLEKHVHVVSTRTDYVAMRKRLVNSNI